MFSDDIAAFTSAPVVRVAVVVVLRCGCRSWEGGRSGWRKRVRLRCRNRGDVRRHQQNGEDDLLSTEFIVGFKRKLLTYQSFEHGDVTWQEVQGTLWPLLRHGRLLYWYMSFWNPLGASLLKFARTGFGSIIDGSDVSHISFVLPCYVFESLYDNR